MCTNFSLTRLLFFRTTALTWPHSFANTMPHNLSRNACQCYTTKLGADVHIISTRVKMFNFQLFKHEKNLQVSWQEAFIDLCFWRWHIIEIKIDGKTIVTYCINKKSITFLLKSNSHLICMLPLKPYILFVTRNLFPCILRLFKSKHNLK